MMKSTTLILALVAAGPWACDGARTEPPAPTASSSTASLSLGGHKFEVTVLSTEKDRRHALRLLSAPSESQGVLLAWPRERFMKIESEGNRTGFDLVFIGASGSIVDLASLKPRDEEGIQPHTPAAYALLLREGTSARLGLKAGEPSTLSREILAAKPEELATVRINGVTAYAELALDDPERQHGLMFRPRMSADDGMLFAYPDEEHRSFWMGNTLIPLDIAFFSGDGTLLNVNETPTYADPRNPGRDYATSNSKGDARFVLEMNLGWFRKKGLVDGSGHIVPGTRAEIPPQAKN